MPFTILQPSETSGVKPKDWSPDWANKLPTDGSAVITPTIVNPSQEGTPAAFGGTAGRDVKYGGGLSPLPTTPYAKSPKDKGTSVPENVLNDKTMFSYSDYNTLMLSKENARLNHLDEKANQYLLHQANEKRFYHLQLGEIINRTVLTVVAIFVDLLNLMKPSEKEKRKDMSFQDKAKVYANVFIIKDRMVYFGVFLIFLSLLFMVVFLSS